MPSKIPIPMILIGGMKAPEMPEPKAKLKEIEHWLSIKSLETESASKEESLAKDEKKKKKPKKKNKNKKGKKGSGEEGEDASEEENDSEESRRRS